MYLVELFHSTRGVCTWISNSIISTTEEEVNNTGYFIKYKFTYKSEDLILAVLDLRFDIATSPAKVAEEDQRHGNSLTWWRPLAAIITFGITFKSRFVHALP